MNYYENMFILSPELDESALENAIERVKSMVVKNSGEVLKAENWGRRKLAYNIKKQNKGIYILLVFKSPAVIISELERYFKVFDPLLKFMIIKLRKKQIESLLSSLQEPVQQPPSTSAQDKPQDQA